MIFTESPLRDRKSVIGSWLRFGCQGIEALSVHCAVRDPQ
jgi:hypothetical protein